MANEAAHIAVVLDRIGRNVLNQLRELPVSALRWALPLPEYHSLFAFAARLVEAGEFWIQGVVGGQRIEHDKLLVELYDRGELAYIIARYERWLAALHEILDDLPDEVMDMLVALPTFYRRPFGNDVITVRDCLLYAIEHSARQQGRIEFLCQLYADGERLHREMRAQRELDEDEFLDDDRAQLPQHCFDTGNPSE